MGELEKYLIEIDNVLKKIDKPEALYREPVFIKRGHGGCISDALAKNLVQKELDIQTIFKNIKPTIEAGDMARDKPYKVPTHDGKYMNKSDRRSEEVLAIWLFAMTTLNNQTVKGLGKCIDYQIPLKKKQDSGFGKLDLMFFDDLKNVLYLVELKNPKNKESVNKAIVEIATYYEILSHEKLISEYELSNNIEIRKVVLVHEDSIAAKDFLSNNIQQLADKLDVSVITYSIDQVDYSPRQMPSFDSFKIKRFA